MKDNKEILKQTILRCAVEQFSIYGIKAVKMDDIASNLKISKRTLYEIYDNKRDLLLDVLIFYQHEFHEKMQKFYYLHDNVMDIIIEFYRLNTEMYSRTNPLFFKDISKYPDLIEKSKEAQNREHQSHFQFIKKGIEDGYFLNIVNYELLSKISMMTLEKIRSSNEYDDYKPEEIFKSFFCVIIRGFCTLKGIERLDEVLI